MKFDSLDAVFAFIDGHDDLFGEVYVIGGGAIYEECLTKYKDQCKLVIGTRINQDFEEADTFMPSPSLSESKDFAPIFTSET